MAEARFDPMLLMIAQQQQDGIDGLLDIFLSFLRRKTDFFTGGGEGVSRVESTVIEAVRRQHAIYTREEQMKAAKKAKATAPAAAKSKTSAPAPEAEEVFSMGKDGNFDITTASTDRPKSTPAEPTQTQPKSQPASSPAPTSAPAGDHPATAPTGSAPGPGNGLVTDRYSWTQTLHDVTITFPVPAGLKSRDVSIDIKAKRLKVAVRGMAGAGGAAGGNGALLDVELPRRVRTEDCNWTVDDRAGGRAVTVYLQKEDGMSWWESVGLGEPSIDLSKVEPENSKLSDLDGDTRKTVEKMMFDQRQKQMGLPSSDDLMKADMLKKFMAAHPEMDFSQAKIM